MGKLHDILKGQLGVPLTVYPWCICIYCVLWGFLGIKTHKYPLYRVYIYIGISHKEIKRLTSLTYEVGGFQLPCSGFQLPLLNNEETSGRDLTESGPTDR